MTQTPTYLRCLAAVMCSALCNVSANAADALMAAIDVNQISVSQSGYCGERRRIDPDDWQRFVVQGDQPVWLFFKAVHLNGKRRSVCTGEGTFTPQGGEAYILRVTHVPRLCQAEMFRAVAGSDPVRVRGTKAEAVGCDSP